MRPIDHLVWAAADLDAGIAAIEGLLRARPERGGVHPGGGTRNALLSLGPRCYLEIIAPDPAQDVRGTPVEWMRKLARPGLVTWAVGVRNLESLLPKAQQLDMETSGIFAMSRKTVVGEILQWKLLRLRRHGLGPVIPFFIDWLESPHPCEGLAAACTLEALTITHPEADLIGRWFDALEIDCPVSRAASISISARVRCPNGVVTLGPAEPLPPAWRD